MTWTLDLCEDLRAYEAKITLQALSAFHFDKGVVKRLASSKSLANENSS